MIVAKELHNYERDIRIRGEKTDDNSIVLGALIGMFP